MFDARIVARERADRLGEGPLWSTREQALYWVDILEHRLTRLDLADEQVRSWDFAEPLGWVIERAQLPGFIAGFRSGIKALTLDPVRLEHLVSPEPDRPGNRLNDAKADHQGRIWAGSMRFDGKGADGALYRLDPDLRCTRVDDGYGIANGPALSADGRWLYHTDSSRRTVYRFGIGGDGGLTPPEVFIAFEEDWGSPDGMTVDAEDHLWIAHWGAACVSRFTPTGERIASIALPASQITSCCFAGPALDRMFVTSAADGVTERHGGALFEVDPGCKGLPPGRFGG